jgi:hypothetical protein
LRYVAALTVACGLCCFTSALPATKDVDPFAEAGVTRAEAADFLVTLQVALAHDDSERVAAMTMFPLTVRGKRGPRDAAELLRDFAAVYNAKVRAAVLAQTVDQLSGNWRGLMIGSGALWAVGTCNADVPANRCRSHRLMIVAVNN